MLQHFLVLKGIRCYAHRYLLSHDKFQYSLYEPIYSGSAKLPRKNDSSSRVNLHYSFVLKCQEV